MNTENSTIDAIIVHEIGDKTLQQSLVLSQSLIRPDSDELELLKGFFLDHFKGFEFYNFRMASPTVPTSRIYQPVAEIFDDPANLMISSNQIARILYPFTETELLSHGYLFICFIRDVMISDELTDAVGLYFCSNNDMFIKPENVGTNPQLRFYDGTFIGKHDMACIIYHTDEEHGFKLDLIDKSKKNKDGQFWKDHFLQVKPAEDEFFQTSHVMGLTKSFVEHQLPMEFEVEKKEQLNYLDRSIDYFKTQDHYSEQDFANQVFDNLDMVESFGNYRQSYEDTHDVALPEDFELDEHAVKKQARHFKSVLKLDRNFHIYIHGDRTMIEKGQDENGKKYYKLYYEKEL